MEKWVTAKQLLKRWSLDPATIIEVVEQGLPTYREWTPGAPTKVDMRDFIRHFSKMHDISEVENWFPIVLFKMSDIESFEEERLQEEGGRTAAERRKDDQLKTERKSFTDAISATVKGLMHCQKQPAPIQKTDFNNYIKKAYPGLPDTFIDEIWRAIPRNHKMAG